jgi:hypothetical protein
LQLGNYQGPGVDVDYTGGYADRNGRFVVTNESLAYYQTPFQDPRYSLEDYENPKNGYYKIGLRTIAVRLGPARLAGEATITSHNFRGDDSSGYTYQPGNRRVRSSPNVEFDYPVATSGGASFYDESYIFLGSKRKFDWKLIGKQEMIIPYSSYKLAWGDVNTVIGAGFPKSEYLRWELHRTWVVEATRKAGERHAFAKRKYYLDEDCPGSAVSDAWDDKGAVVRGGFGSCLWIWDYQQNFGYAWVSDLLTNTYGNVAHPGNGKSKGVKFRRPETGLGGYPSDGKMLEDGEYTPDALARRSAR